VITLAIIIAANILFLKSITNSNQVLLNDLIGSVSGTVTSVALCKVLSNQNPQDCTYMDEASKISFVKYVHQAKKSLRPGHSRSINRYMIKITSIGKAPNIEKKHCFLIDEIRGIDDLYISKIDAGENCSNSNFKYLEGSVKIHNFLTTR
jgi:hypothetical protein